MIRHLDEDLSNFNKNLLRLASLAEGSINRSIGALKNQDKKLATQVIADDNKIDELENKIEEQAMDLLALHQPLAIDLRFITTGMHINSELERIADMAVNICRRILEMADIPLVNPLINIPQLADIAKKMVRDAIDSFVKRDEDLAREIIVSDQEADRLRNEIMKVLIYDYIVKDGSTAPRAVPLLLIARDLERICDHATAIAEDVIYMVRAKIVKHHPEKLDAV